MDCGFSDCTQDARPLPHGISYIGTQPSLEITDILSREIQKLAHLTLTRFSRDMDREICAGGGYYDVFKGVLRTPGAPDRTIAAKRIRVHLHDNPGTSIVNSYVSL